MKSGYYPGMPMADYLADPCDEPSLSTSTVCDLVERTPLHAHANHPRLGGKPSDSSQRMYLGSAIHSRILGGYEIVYVDAKDWRTKAAQEFRDTARVDSKIPMLESQREVIERAGDNAMNMLVQSVAKFWMSEVTMLWQAHDVWMRGRADILTDLYDIDVKTVESADPYKFRPFANGYDAQAGLRMLGHQTLGQPREMLWLLVEINPPYACSLVGMDQTMRELAERKIKHAAAKWRKCLGSGVWPGYDAKPVWVGATTYQALELDSRGVPE